MARSKSVRRFNIRALIYSAGLILVVAAFGAVAAFGFGNQMSDKVLAQARELIEEDQAGLARRHLGDFLRREPDNVPVLELYADLLYQAVKAGDQERLVRALDVNQRLLTLDPEGADRQSTRKIVGELLILRATFDRQFARGASNDLQEELVERNSRISAATRVLQELISRGGDEVDAEAYRLLGISFELQILRETINPNVVNSAIAAYDKALELDPTDVEAAARKARLHRDFRIPPEYEIASATLENLIKAAPESARAYLAVYEHFVREDRARASEALQKALDYATETDVAVRLTAASDALERGDTSTARRLIKELPQQAAGLGDVELLSGLIALADQQPDEAIASWQQGLRALQGTDLKLVWTLANALIDAGKLDQAKPLIERYRTIGSAESAPFYLMLRGLFAQASGDPEQALREFEQAEDAISDPQRPLLLMAMARCQVDLNDRTAAIRNLEEAISLDPSNPDPRIALAEVLRMESMDDAIRQINEGINAAPSNVKLRRAQLGLLLEKEIAKPASERDWAEFRTNLERGRQALGENSPLLTALESRQLLLTQQSDRSIEILRDATEQFPEVSSNWLLLSDTLAKVGQLPEALQVLEEGSKPENAGDGISFRVGRARLLVALDRGREALQVLTEGAATLPTEQRGAIYRTLGRMQAARGLFEEAEATYNAWRTLQPGTADPLLALLDLTIDIGDAQGAQRYLELLRGETETPPLPYLLGRAEVMLRMPVDDPITRARQAEQLLDRVLAPKASSGYAQGFLLRGLARQRLGKYPEALADLRTAWVNGELRAGGPLVELLVSQKRIEELEVITRPPGLGFQRDINRLAAEACYRYGYLEEAKDYIEKAAVTLGRNPQYESWRLALLERIGEPKEVERTLLTAAERSDATVEEWFALIRYYASRERLPDAEQALNRLKLRFPEKSQDLLEGLGRASMGQLDEGYAALEKGLETDPENTDLLLAATAIDEQAKRYDSVIERTRKILEVDPDNANAKRLLAINLARKSREAENQQEAWEEAWAVFGPEPDEDEEPESPRDRLARALVQATHPDSAERGKAAIILRNLIEDLPATEVLTIAARETLARLLYQQGDAKGASEIAAVTASSSANFASIAFYTLLLIDSGQFDEADRQLQRLERIQPDASDLVVLRVRLAEATETNDEDAALALEKQYQEAIEKEKPESSVSIIFTRLTQLGDPVAEVTERVGRDLGTRFPELAWGPARWFAVRGDIDTAIELAETALKTGGERQANEVARIMASFLSEKRVDPESSYADRAEELTREALEAHPESAQVQASLAMVLQFRGRVQNSKLDEVVSIYRGMLQESPDSILILNNLAWALSEFKDEPAEALVMIDRAIKNAPQKLNQLIDTRGVILERLGRLDEAINELQSISERDPENPVYRFHYARALSKIGRTEEAKAELATAIENGLDAEDLDPREVDELKELQNL